MAICPACGTACANAVAAVAATATNPVAIAATLTQPQCGTCGMLVEYAGHLGPPARWPDALPVGYVVPTPPVAVDGMGCPAAIPWIVAAYPAGGGGAVVATAPSAGVAGWAKANWHWLAVIAAIAAIVWAMWHFVDTDEATTVRVDAGTADAGGVTATADAGTADAAAPAPTPPAPAPPVADAGVYAAPNCTDTTHPRAVRMDLAARANARVQVAAPNAAENCEAPPSGQERALEVEGGHVWSWHCCTPVVTPVVTP